MAALTEKDYPRELAPGNVVRLKEPYSASVPMSHTGDGRGRKVWTHGVIAQVLSAGQSYGPANPYFRVSLHLYNPEAGTIYLHEPSGIPTYVDFGADEVVLVKVARHVGYGDRDHDLYPDCGACDEGWLHTGTDHTGAAIETRCRRCGGFGKLFTPLPSAPHPETV